MKGTLKRKKKKFWKPAAACFLALYLMTMGLATLLEKEKITDEYIRTFEEVAESLLRKASDQEMLREEWGDEQRKEFYQSLANEYFWNTPNPQLNISVAFYDEERKMLAESNDSIGDGTYIADTSGINYGPYALDDYLTFEQKEELARYYWKSKQSGADFTVPEKYRISIRTSSDGRKLYDIFVQEIVWEEGEDAQENPYEDPLTGSITSMQTGTVIDYATGAENGTEKIFYETDSKVVWEWSNPGISNGQREKGEIQGTVPAFPYMSSYENWHRWAGSEFLHGFSKPEVTLWEEDNGELGIYAGSGVGYFRGRYQLKAGFVDDPDAYMDIRIEERPWVDAIGYMKYLYLMGMIMTLACMFLVILEFNQFYDRQMTLEETRRDFTNALAHELKTPLSVIRNFTENLIEHNMEEKRDYYLTQVIGQTEEMDYLVEEMIEISKLDSEELVLKKETISFADLIREQMDRFDSVIEEKNIQIQYQKEADFIVEGDREYLAKAVWNLLSNAVDYNVPDGWIKVRTKAGQCVIENAGKPLEEEQLLHAFDLFYTGDRIRSEKGKHMGMGLFLAKKIIELHGMKLTLENVENGIRAVISRD